MAVWRGVDKAVPMTAASTTRGFSAIAMLKSADGYLKA
jgi:hypothetical protein